jgi:hypothetical protein
VSQKPSYPGGAEFAFTVLDDTDDATLANCAPVYELLRDAGLRTTKTVWTLDVPPERRGIYWAGETLRSPDYLAWVRELHRDGFEIAFHNAAMASSVREDTVMALDMLETELGRPVRLHCNHGQNRENLYWGKEKYGSLPGRAMLRFAGMFRPFAQYEGNNPGSEYFWADVADQRLSYMRRLAFRHLDGQGIPPGRPYREPGKLNHVVFFNTADAANVVQFNKLVTKKSIDQLRRRNGWAIVSTHFGKGFCRAGKLDRDFRNAIEYLSSLPGWYVPVSEMLDHLSSELGCDHLSPTERMWMECAHMFDRVVKDQWIGRKTSRDQRRSVG